MDATIPITSAAHLRMAPGGDLERADVERRVRDALAEIGYGEVGSTRGSSIFEAHLEEDFGLDSIEIVELIGIAWESCGLDTRIPTASDVETLGALVGHVCEELRLPEKGT